MEEATTTPRDRLLIVDDDEELCELLIEYLGSEGFAVECVHNCRAGVETALTGRFALVVLDVMLPGGNGFDVLGGIRASSRVPVLMLTARTADVDRIVGLELGADDYLQKPFNPRELVARVRAILRRTTIPSNGSDNDRVIRVGDVTMHLGQRVVRKNGEIVELTSVEFCLLEALLRAAGTVVDRDDLWMQVLGRRRTPYDRSLDMHISNLRKKLGHRIGGLERISTIRGIGYQYSTADPGDIESGEENE